MRRFSKRSASGQSLVMFALVAALLVMVLGLSIDASGAWWKSQRQTDALEVAKEAVLARANAIKFTDDDSCKETVDIAKEAISDNLPDADKLGLSVTAWEEPESKTGAADRLIGVEVTLESDYPCAFASTFGFKKIPVKSTVDFTINPYSSSQVWRQTSDGHGFNYKRDKEGNDVSAGKITADANLSESLKEAIQKGLSDLS